MYIIVGLGNPGQKYTNTRHNVGFMVADRLKKFGLPKSKCLLVKPQTFMNRSGEAVKKVIYDKLERLWVIHDDLDLSLGTVRIKFGGSSAGHLGVQSVIDALGSDQFWRIRVGIDRPFFSGVISGEQLKRAIANYVLKPFPKTDQTILEKVVDLTAQNVLQYLEQGYIVGETIKISNSVK